MPEENKGPQLQLSGYQPSREASGLGVMAKGLYEAFMEALRTNDQTGESLRFPVVGVLEGRVGHIGRPGSDKEPSIELRFIAIEPVVDRDVIPAVPAAAAGLLGELNDAVGDNAEAQKLLDLLHEALNVKPQQRVVGLMHQLRDVRLGEQPIDGLELTTSPAEPVDADGAKSASSGETTNGNGGGRKPRSTRKDGNVLAAEFSSN